jgi:hypothetical protein
VGNEKREETKLETVLKQKLDTSVKQEIHPETGDLPTAKNYSDFTEPRFLKKPDHKIEATRPRHGGLDFGKCASVIVTGVPAGNESAREATSLERMRMQP